MDMSSRQIELLVDKLIDKCQACKNHYCRAGDVYVCGVKRELLKKIANGRDKGES